jgi:hypothetical protein
VRTVRNTACIGSLVPTTPAMPVASSSFVRSSSFSVRRRLTSPRRDSASTICSLRNGFST